MKTVKNALGKLADVLSALDDAFMASSVAQSGEPELARRMMIEARNIRRCCGEIEAGCSCIKELKDRCPLAIRQGA